MMLISTDLYLSHLEMHPINFLIVQRYEMGIRTEMGCWKEDLTPSLGHFSAASGSH